MSLVSRRPVTDELLYYFPATFELTAASMLISLVMGIFLGIVSAVRRNRLIDHLARTYTIVGISIPIFWLALLLLLVFYVKLGWFPGGGRIADGIEVQRITGFLLADALLTGNWAGLGSAMWHLILPAYCLSCAHPGHDLQNHPGLPCSRNWARNTSRQPGPREFPKSRSWASMFSGIQSCPF